jgi:hypothetical protein
MWTDEPTDVMVADDEDVFTHESRVLGPYFWIKRYGALQPHARSLALHDTSVPNNREHGQPMAVLWTAYSREIRSTSFATACMDPGANAFLADCQSGLILLCG